MSSQYFWCFFPRLFPLCHSILLRIFVIEGVRGLQSPPTLGIQGSEKRTERQSITIPPNLKTERRLCTVTLVRSICCYLARIQLGQRYLIGIHRRPSINDVVSSGREYLIRQVHPSYVLKSQEKYIKEGLKIVDFQKTSFMDGTIRRLVTSLQ